MRPDDRQCVQVLGPWTRLRTLSVAISPLPGWTADPIFDVPLDPLALRNFSRTQAQAWIETSRQDPQARQDLLSFIVTPPRTAEELWWWFSTVLGIEIPMTVCCEERGHVAPFTAVERAFFAKEPIAIWKASRGFGGKTLILSALTCAESITLGASVSLPWWHCRTERKGA